MDAKTRAVGIKYEILLKRAHQNRSDVLQMGADRRNYYLLHFIKIGFDLRQTGYPTQFNNIKKYVTQALQALLRQELHKEEKSRLRKMLKQMDTVWTEAVLEKLIDQALRVSSRISAKEEEMVLV